MSYSVGHGSNCPCSECNAIAVGDPTQPTQIGPAGEVWPPEWIRAGARASAEFWGDPQPDHLDERAAVAVLRAVVPMVREQIAADIKADRDAHLREWLEEVAYDRCARIARGVVR